MEGDEGWPFENSGDELGSAHPQEDADHPANQAQDQGFDEELVKDVPSARAHGHADADLPGALGHGHKHDIHDANPSNQQGNGGNSSQEKRHHPGRFLSRRHSFG